MARPTALLDACILYPAPLRDLLVSLAVAGLFHAKWTDAIHEEWIGNLLRDRADLNRERLERTRGKMERAAPDARIEGFESLIPQLILPDPDDRHVLAAAIHERVDVIVTSNLADFPSEALVPFEIEARHPDLFVSGFLERHESATLAAIKELRKRLKNPEVAPEAYLATLQSLLMTKTVLILGRHLDQI